MLTTPFILYINVAVQILEVIVVLLSLVFIIWDHERMMKGWKWSDVRSVCCCCHLTFLHAETLKTRCKCFPFVVTLLLRTVCVSELDFRWTAGQIKSLCWLCVSQLRAGWGRLVVLVWSVDRREASAALTLYGHVVMTDMLLWCWSSGKGIVEGISHVKISGYTCVWMWFHSGWN